MHGEELRPPTESTPRQPAGTAFRSVSGLRRWVVILLALGVLIDCAAVVSSLAERDLLGRLESVTDAEADQNDSRQLAIGVAQIATLLVTAIIFLIWFHRAYKNLLAFGTELPHGTGWAVGAWFIPILNLFRPKGIADAIWQASDPNLEEPVDEKWREAEAPIFLHVWWVAWVLAWIAGRVVTATSRSLDTVEQLLNYNTAVLVADGLGAVAGVLAIMFVKGATQRQEAKVQQSFSDKGPDLRGGSGSENR